ncbi:MAG TPA: hypothetical protein VEI97_03735 [bacterium]|nr:hypothetical protein [bacterium]
MATLRREEFDAILEGEPEAVWYRAFSWPTGEWAVLCPRGGHFLSWEPKGEGPDVYANLGTVAVEDYIRQVRSDPRVFEVSPCDPRYPFVLIGELQEEG